MASLYGHCRICWYLSTSPSTDIQTMGNLNLFYSLNYLAKLANLPTFITRILIFKVFKLASIRKASPSVKGLTVSRSKTSIKLYDISHLVYLELKGLAEESVHPYKCTFKILCHINIRFKINCKPCL